jgi:hypothetical protein
LVAFRVRAYQADAASVAGQRIDDLHGDSLLFDR